MIGSGRTGVATRTARNEDDTPGTGGGVTQLTSTDESVTITNPTGPVVDLSVPPSGAATVATVYADGASAADQTAVLKSAKGGGVVIDGTNAAFDGATNALHVKGNTALAALAPIRVTGSGVNGEGLRLESGAQKIVVPDNTLVLDGSAGAILQAGGVAAAQFDTAANLALGGQAAQLATGAVAGFASLPSMHGAPTGVPTASWIAGSPKQAPQVYDDVNKGWWTWDLATTSWKFTPATSAGVFALANMAALAALPSAGLTAGVVYVGTLKARFALQQSALPVDSITVVNASGLAGFQWVRVYERNDVWAARTTWLVDPQNVAASDEATGLGGAPLKTLTELSRRLANAVFATGVTIAVTLASDCLNTDKVAWTWTVQPGAAAGTGVVVTGTPTVVYTGSLTSAFVQQVQGSIATATDNEMTDAAIPVSYTASGLTGSGLIYQRTNSTACYWWPLKDLGAKTLRMTDALNAGATAVTTIANGDTYTVSRLPKLYDQHFAVAPGRVAYITFALCDDNSVQSANPIFSAKLDAPVIFDRCTFSTARLLGNARLLNCAQFANVSPTSSGVLRMDGGCRVSATSMTVQNGCAFETGTATVHFQGCGILLNGVGHGAGQFAVYDSATGFYVVSGNASINNIKGLGNTGKLLRCQDYGATIGFNSTTVPTATGASTSDANFYQCGNTAVPGTSQATLPLTAEITNRLSGIVPF